MYKIVNDLIKDIAELAKVSSASVSRILNNDPTLSVPKETRQRVLDAANQLAESAELRKALGRSGRQYLEANFDVKHSVHKIIRHLVSNV